VCSRVGRCAGGGFHQYRGGGEAITGHDIEQFDTTTPAIAA
jgi:hypothetical protein